MGQRGPLPTSLRDYVLALYWRGNLNSCTEGATIAGVSRQRVMQWLVAAGIDWQSERLRFLARHRTRAVAIHEGRSVARPTKRELRQRSDQALAEWAAKPERSA